MKERFNSKGGGSDKPRGPRKKQAPGKPAPPTKRDGKGAAPKPWHKNSAPAREPADDICWGRQPVLDLVKTSPGRCTKLIIANNTRPPFLDELVDAARSGKVVYQMAAPEALDSLCPGVRHQGVACRITETKLLELEPFLKGLPENQPALIVVLDHIEDPHNLGSIVRSAEAAGAAAVVFPKRRSALPGGTVVKVSAGAAMRVPMIPVVNVTRCVELLKAAGFWTVGMEKGSENSLWGGTPFQAKTALVIGAEDEGLSRLVSESCDQLVQIPVRGVVGSLNAGVAAALGMFEWSRVYTQ